MASGKIQKNDRKAILRHLKPGGYGFTIAFFVLVLGISAIAIKLFIDAFLSYVIDNKVSSEYQNIQYLATIYEQQIDKDNALYDIIDKDNRPYVVFDKDDNIVEQNGENTMGDTKGMVSIAGRLDGIDAYSDTTLPEPMMVSRDGEMEISDYVIAVIKKAIFTAPGKGEDSQLFVDLDKEDLKNGISQDKADKMLKKGISMPLWLGVDVKDGTEQFYGRALIVLNFKDGMFLIIFIAAISVIIFGRTDCQKKKVCIGRFRRTGYCFRKIPQFLLMPFRGGRRGTASQGKPDHHQITPERRNQHALCVRKFRSTSAL